jgi:hypothetical protein
MKTILGGFLLLASSAIAAEEAVERASIATTISWLNGSVLDPDLFTADFPDSAELTRGAQGNFGARVVISKEPWGEATWFPLPASRTPRFVIQSVRFVTPDVAVVDGIDRQNESRSVLFVVKKDGIAWRIAAFRRVGDAIKIAP